MKLRILPISPRQVAAKVTLQVDGRLIFNIRASEILRLAQAKSIILYVDEDSPGRDIYVEASPNPPQAQTYRLREGKSSGERARPFFYAMTTKFFKEYGLPFEKYRIKFKMESHRFRYEHGKLIRDKHGDRLYVKLVEAGREERGPKTKRNRRNSGREQTVPFPTITLPDAPWTGVPEVNPATLAEENHNGTNLPSNSVIEIGDEESTEGRGNE